LEEAAAQVVVAGFEPDAANQRRGKRRGVELPIDVVRAASGAGVGKNADASAIIRRAGDVLTAGAALVGYADRVSAGRIGAPDSGEPPSLGALRVAS
jgi:hypothetical protein